MGGPSGSGVATTVTIGTVAYPLLEKAGYDKNAAGGLLAAGGLGAIISPPVLGAAAFLIAEFLKISYFDVIVMATIPTVLYYFAILVMVEIDARKQGGVGRAAGRQGRAVAPHQGLLVPLRLADLHHRLHAARLLAGAVGVLGDDAGDRRQRAALRHRHRAVVAGASRCSLSLGIVIPQLLGLAGQRAVHRVQLAPDLRAALAVGAALGLFAPQIAPVHREARARRMKDGTTGVLNVAATCATAGIIVGVVTLTGLAQRFADIIIGYAQGSLLLTAMFTAAIVWIVGLAVPVTASYIMCAVIAAPALIKLGVPDFAAHMFIFYYAVLSEVSPPTALSPFAAAAITGGNPYLTTLQSWKYTMPAFLVPFVFVLDPQGIGLLLKVPQGRQLARHRRDLPGDGGRHRHAGVRRPGLVLEEEHRSRDGAVRRRRPVPGVPGRPLADDPAVDGLVASTASCRCCRISA